jgi:hypothetical protein
MFTFGQATCIILLSSILILMILCASYNGSVGIVSPEWFTNVPSVSNCQFGPYKSQEYREDIDKLLLKYFFNLKLFIGNSNAKSSVIMIRDDIINFNDSILNENGYIDGLVYNNLDIMESYIAATKANDLSKKYLFKSWFIENLSEIGKAFDSLLSCCIVENSFDGRFRLCNNKFFTEKMMIYAEFIFS